MRVVLYTQPCFFDAVLSAVPFLSDLVELHLIVELPPEQWQSSLFDIPIHQLPAGIVDGKPLLRLFFPRKAVDALRKVSSFNFIVHNHKRSLHPATLIANNKIISFIKDRHPEIVHFDDISLRMSLSIFRLRQYNIVLSIHDPIYHSGENTWRDALSRKLAFRWVNHFILHNHRQKQAFISRYRLLSHKVKTIPLGIYNAYRYWQNIEIQQAANTILFFGRLSAYKGIETLLQAALRVAEKLSGIQVIIAGRPPTNYTIPPIPPLPNDGSILLIDNYISNARAAELFQKATVVVCPYHEATQSGVVLAAYAFDRPVIATRTGGLPEYVEDGNTGILVDPRNAVQLANAIITVLSDRKKQQKFKTGINKISEDKLNWKNIARQTINFYSHFLSNNS